MTITIIDRTGTAGETVVDKESNFWAGKQPCWEMCQCPEVIKEECPASKYTSYPCWEIEGTYCKLDRNGTNGRDTSICKVCRVYKRWGDSRPIQLKLFGRGIDVTIHTA
ncbi:MAG: hypothetical protein N3E40_02075, partial [Dehalococcoidia bacterium]|nr:hypothetical protein [Dehalococcoidia bacterium]